MLVNDKRALPLLERQQLSPALSVGGDVCVCRSSTNAEQFAMNRIVPIERVRFLTLSLSQ